MQGNHRLFCPADEDIRIDSENEALHEASQPVQKSRYMTVCIVP
jgi:hypothetical protein